VTSTPQPKKSRSPEEIEKDLAATRARFTATLDELSVRVQPDELGQDVSEVASAAASESVTRAKEWAGLTEESSGPRPELIGALAGAGLAIVILLWRSRRSTVSYEFMLPNDQVALEEVLVRARGRKVPRGLGGEAV
jgi:hypothetical protein